MLVDGSPVRPQERATRPKKDLDAPASVVSDYIAAAPRRHLPQMLLATTLVAVLPLAVSLALRATGLVSGWVSVGLAVAMSLGCSTAGNAFWRKRGNHGEVLFGELLLWGWIRSWRQERELANATRLLGLVGTTTAQHVRPDELDVEQREQLLQQLAGGLEGQDIYLNGHSRRVARHATMIARGMGLSSEEVARIRVAAAVHDVGKLHTPKAVLNKPGRLTDAEFEVIKRHPVDGAEMVAALGDPELTRIVRHHHERLDGGGYPDGLRGEEIPIGARIIAVADTFDAITSARPYRDAAPHQKAIDILRKEAGTQLDPDAVRTFLAYYSGRRPMVLWAIVTSTLRRVVAWLSGDPAAAATLSAGKVAAATVATAAIGAAAGAAPVPVVYHAPARPAIAHTHIHGPVAGTRSASIGSRRQTVAVPATPAVAAAADRRSTSSGKRTATRRRGADRATTQRARARSAPRWHAGAPATATGTRTRAGAASRTSPAPHAPGHSTGSSPSSSGSVVSSTAQRPSRIAPATGSQGSNANGNAYGHTKSLGNGHGKGLAKGHSNPSPSRPSSSGHPSIPAPALPTPPAVSGSSHGDNGGSSHGDGHAFGSDNGHGSGAVKTNVSATATPVTSAVSLPVQPAGNLAGQGNGADHGHGNSHGNGGGD